MRDENIHLEEITDTELSNLWKHEKDWFSPYREEHCRCGQKWPCDFAILKEMLDRGLK